MTKGHARQDELADARDVMADARDARADVRAAAEDRREDLSAAKCSHCALHRLWCAAPAAVQWAVLIAVLGSVITVAVKWGAINATLEGMGKTLQRLEDKVDSIGAPGTVVINRHNVTGSAQVTP